MEREINFDGIVGPSHNFAGLSLGNLAATRSAGQTSHPREAALQGIDKMRVTLDLGLAQGLFVPHARPADGWLHRLGTTMAAAGPGLRANALSASAMWAANAATVSPAPDTADGRCHLTVANLQTMAHRSHEWPETLAQLRLAFADTACFAVHGPVPSPFGDEGAANHMRLCEAHGRQGVEVFVHGRPGGPYPARQHAEAGAAIARLHGLDPARVIVAEQSPEALAAGAFHNDVVAVANETVLFAHEQAFADPDGFYAALRERLPGLVAIEVPRAAISLEEAIATYLFNAQLVSLPEGGMALVLPAEARENARVWAWLEALAASGGPVRRLVVVDVRQSMGNGGGPACLRLRVVADPERVDPRFLASHALLDRLEAVIARHWPVDLHERDFGSPALWRDLHRARSALLGALDLAELDGPAGPA